MSIRERMSGNEAIAIAMKQINPDVVPAFPITPSTEIPQYFSKFVADGSVDTEFIPVESEHSAMSAAMGSQAAGARTMTATSSCGLALMWEMLYVVASARLPVTLACVNRLILMLTTVTLWEQEMLDGFNYIVKLTKKLMTICYKLIELENTQMYNFQ